MALDPVMSYFSLPPQRETSLTGEFISQNGGSVLEGPSEKGVWARYGPFTVLYTCQRSPRTARFRSFSL